jgi:hypothetical protein
MKECFSRTKAFVLCLCLAAGTLWFLPAQLHARKDQWVLRLGGSANLYMGEFSDDYGLGFGGDAAIGYGLDDHWVLSLESGYYAIPGKRPGFLPSDWNFSHEARYAPILLALNYGFGSGPVRPFIGGGGGLTLHDNYFLFGPPDQPRTRFAGETAGFLVDARVGVEVGIEPKVNLFLQVKGQFNFLPDDYANESPMLHLLPQVGLSFWE